METNDIFARNLNIFLNYYNMTQAELAEKVGVGKSSISYYCLGEKFPRMGVLDKMTEVFHCKRSDLLENDISEESIQKTARMKVVLDYLEKLNDDGVTKITEILKDLHPKYFKEEDDV